MISERSATSFQNEKRKRTLLIVTEHPPHSYRPAGERILHTAVASSSFFETVVILSLRGVGKQDMTKKTRVKQPSGASLYAVKFVRGMLYPVAALFDPIKFLILLVHGLLLSRRYKPLCILTSVPPLETAVSAWILSKRSNSTLIIDLRDDWESAVAAQFGQFFPEAILHLMVTIANKIYSNALLIFAATQTIVNSIRRRGVATHTFLVPNGADTSVFLAENESVRRNLRKKYNLPLNKVVAIYCGSGTIPYYRLDYVLSSARFLSKEAENRIYIVFYVYDGAEKLKRMLKRLGVADNIFEIRDPLPRKSLAEVLAASDVGLLPFADRDYLLCAKSTKLFEYLSSGLYVVTSGPKRGELDTFFSTHSALGMFISPSAKKFALSFGYLLKNTENLFGEDLRKFRHSFIKKNYDRKSIMRRAMKILSEHISDACETATASDHNRIAKPQE